MPEVVVTRGVDTHVDQSTASRNYSDARYPKLSSQSGAQKRVLLSIDPGDVLGRQVLAATLSVPVQDAITAQTWTVQALASRVSLSQVTWDTAPAVSGPTATVSTGSVAAGGRVSIDVTALVAAISNGGSAFGWRISTSTTAGASLQGFESGAASTWILTTTLSDVPQAPTNLTPSGGVIGVNKWVARADWADLDGLTDTGAVQVHVDANMTSTYDFDSGTVVTTVPELDLATTAYGGLANNATTNWRIRVRNSAGVWSEWSDWAQVTRVDKPTQTITSPGSTTWVGNPVVTASLSAGTYTSATFSVFDAVTGEERWTSGPLWGLGNTISAQVPLKSKNGWGTALLIDGRTYRYVARGVDRTDRVSGGPSDPPYIETVVTSTFDQDATITKVTGLAAAATFDGSPGVRLYWERTTAPTTFVVLRDGQRVAELDPADVSTGTNAWEWVDRGAAPNTTASYTVRSVQTVSGGLRESEDPSPVSRLNKVSGLWLVTDKGDVCLAGTDLGSLAVTERRTTFDLPYRPDSVSILGALGGVAGSFKGWLYGDETKTRADRALLDLIRRDRAGEVLMVYGTTAAPVRVTGLSVQPDDTMLPEYGQLTHSVSFLAEQVGDFDRVG